MSSVLSRLVYSAFAVRQLGEASADSWDPECRKELVLKFDKLKYFFLFSVLQLEELVQVSFHHRKSFYFVEFSR